jgi:hypothetical protein
MKKLFKMILSANINKVDIDRLCELIESTSYPEITLEYLLGVYETPSICEVPNKDFNSSQKNKTFVSFDVLKQEVKYSYNQTETKYIKPNDPDGKLLDYYDVTSEERNQCIRKEIISEKLSYNNSKLNYWINE